ncbi:MAG: hypothetical protein QOD82_2832, partial [Pseudonocardiales bacterium]|nr:hypothetical protein [Pseudonocardiales bacterium]
MTSTAPTAVAGPVAWAIWMNSATAAPPGSMTNGIRAPSRHGPRDWMAVPTPESRKSAASRFAPAAGARCS